MKQECLVSFLRRSRTSTMLSLSLGNLSLSLSLSLFFWFPSLYPRLSLSLSLSFVSPKHRERERERERHCSHSRTTVGVYTIPSCSHDDAHRFSVSVDLSAAGSERASVHKRVINYLRVGHVFPSYSLSLSQPSRSLLPSPSHSVSPPFIEPRPGALLSPSLDNTHTITGVSLVRHAVSLSDTLCPRTHSVCLHTRSYVNSA